MKREKIKMYRNSLKFIGKYLFVGRLKAIGNFMGISYLFIFLFMLLASSFNLNDLSDLHVFYGF